MPQRKRAGNVSISQEPQPPFPKLWPHPLRLAYYCHYIRSNWARFFSENIDQLVDFIDC